MTRTTFHRIAAFGLGLLLVTPLALTSFPRPAYALFGDDLLAAKELTLDPIAWLVAKTAIQSLTKSTVNWINSGFQGSPAFVTDLEGHMLQVADVAAANFAHILATDPALNSPFQSKIAQAAYAGYLISTSKDAYVSVNGYNLNQVTRYDREFLRGDFINGGWDAWLSAVMNPQNNPYGARILADNGMEITVSASQNTATIELNWGQGFLSWCDTSGTKTKAGSTKVAAQTVEIEGGGTLEIPGYDDPNAQINNIADSFAEVNASAPNDAQICSNKDGTAGTIKTPGSVIRDQINKTLGTTGDQLVTADEFNEIVGALISQLTSQVLGGVGLGGASSPSSQYSRSYINTATDDESKLLSANAAGSILTAVTSATQEMLRYQTDWNTLSAEADAASCTDDALVTQIKTQAGVAQANATVTLSGLSDVNAEINAASNTSGAQSQATKLQNASTHFQEVLAHSPSSEEVDTVGKEVVDNSNDKNATPTLFAKLKKLADSCD